MFGFAFSFFRWKAGTTAPPPPENAVPQNAILTQDGRPIVTEDGRYVVTENAR